LSAKVSTGEPEMVQKTAPESRGEHGAAEDVNRRPLEGFGPGRQVRDSGRDRRDLPVELPLELVLVAGQGALRPAECSEVILNGVDLCVRGGQQRLDGGRPRIDGVGRLQRHMNVAPPLGERQRASAAERQEVKRDVGRGVAPANAPGLRVRISR
jgi:hypothetical protein